MVIDLINRGIFTTELIHCNDHHTALIPWLLKNRNIESAYEQITKTIIASLLIK